MFKYQSCSVLLKFCFKKVRPKNSRSLYPPPHFSLAHQWSSQGIISDLDILLLDTIPSQSKDHWDPQSLNGVVSCHLTFHWAPQPNTRIHHYDAEGGKCWVFSWMFTCIWMKERHWAREWGETGIREAWVCYYNIERLTLLTVPYN